MPKDRPSAGAATAARSMLSRSPRIPWLPTRGPLAVPLAERSGGQPALAASAVVVGVLTGLVAATFRILLEHAGEARLALVHWAHGSPVLGFALVVLACAAGTSAAAWLVHGIEPHAEGSGIPRVEAVVEGRKPPGRFRILPVKYAGGLLSIGSGLALGREGPSVQMGGTIAAVVGRALRRSSSDVRLLVAAGAAAGLATAFNAPIAGGVFVLEELLKRFDPRTSLATLVASAAGFASAHVLLNSSTTDFTVPHFADPALAQAPIVLAVGVASGLVGAAYNWSVIRSLRIADTSRWPVVARAALIGAAVGAVGWFGPGLVGGGDNLTQQALLGQGTIVTVTALLLLRFVLGVVSYAACTPGGLFAPMLVLGSNVGLLVALVGQVVAPHQTPEPAALALIGMAAFFTASVRAPVTGLVLATEMTGSTTLLAPMLGACAVAMLTAAVLRSAPIYDQLTQRAVNATRVNAAEGHPD